MNFRPFSKESEMTAQTRYQAIAHLNSLQINQTAGALLPPDWRTPTSLNVLSLAQWGTENGIFPELEEQVLMLDNGDPAHAMSWVTEAPDGGEVLAPDALEGLSREDAASLILNSISDRMTS